MNKKNWVKGEKNSFIPPENKFFIAEVNQQKTVSPFLGNSLLHTTQGCQMVCFQTKNHNLGKIFRASDWKKFDIFYGHLEFFMDIWDIL
jgi:hypothetical protein